MGKLISERAQIEEAFKLSFRGITTGFKSENSMSKDHLLLVTITVCFIGLITMVRLQPEQVLVLMLKLRLSTDM